MDIKELKNQNTRFFPIKNCEQCPKGSHSGAFTDGGAIPLCKHEKFYREKVKDRYIGRERPRCGSIPDWCPLSPNPRVMGQV